MCLKKATFQPSEKYPLLVVTNTIFEQIYLEQGIRIWNTSLGKSIPYRAPVARITMDTGDKNKKTGVMSHNAEHGCAHCLSPHCEFGNWQVEYLWVFAVFIYF